MINKSTNKNSAEPIHPNRGQTGKIGFSLIEALVYIAVLSIIITAVVSFILWSVYSYTKAKVARETLDNAERVIRVITNEIREADSIYTPTTTASQLSLETVKYLPLGEEITYIDFYLCDSRLCFKKESQDPIVLTSDEVEITNLTFNQISSGGVESSIQISLTIDYKNPTGRSEYDASVSLTSTASLR